MCTQIETKKYFHISQPNHPQTNCTTARQATHEHNFWLGFPCYPSSDWCLCFVGQSHGSNTNKNYQSMFYPCLINMQVVKVYGMAQYHKKVSKLKGILAQKVFSMAQPHERYCKSAKTHSNWLKMQEKSWYNVFNNYGTTSLTSLINNKCFSRIPFVLILLLILKRIIKIDMQDKSFIFFNFMLVCSVLIREAVWGLAAALCHL